MHDIEISFSNVKSRIQKLEVTSYYKKWDRIKVFQLNRNQIKDRNLSYIYIIYQCLYTEYNLL